MTVERFVQVPVGTLESLISMAHSHVEDINSGIEEGIYMASENTNITEKVAHIASAEQSLLDALPKPIHANASIDPEFRKQVQGLIDVSAVLNGIQSRPAVFSTDTQLPQERSSESKFTNHYLCPCGEEWQDVWSCGCNDRCPSCNKEIEPFASNDGSMTAEEIESWRLAAANAVGIQVD